METSHSARSGKSGTFFQRRRLSNKVGRTLNHCSLPSSFFKWNSSLSLPQNVQAAMGTMFRRKLGCFVNHAPTHHQKGQTDARRTGLRLVDKRERNALLTEQEEVKRKWSRAEPARRRPEEMPADSQTHTRPSWVWEEVLISDRDDVVTKLTLLTHREYDVFTYTEKKE